jgi:hypothetical protein
MNKILNLTERTNELFVYDIKTQFSHIKPSFWHMAMNKILYILEIKKIQNYYFGDKFAK